MATAVVQGAILNCTCGSTATELTVTSQGHTMCGNQLAATIADNKLSTNIPPFGTCARLTAAAGGTPTPCALSATGPWSPGSTSELRIADHAALLTTDKLVCSVGGVITISDPGQQATVST